ncbi:MAG: hypothetical protein WEE67_08555 [Chloroflexota bacterium]
MNTVGGAARLAVAVMLLTAVCGAISFVSGGDPMLAPELASASFIAAWLVHVVRAACGALVHSRRLSVRSKPASIGGTTVWIIPDPVPVACVSGLLRPRIYLSASLLDMLDDGELRGVLLHESHHRATLAPFRSLVLDAWQRTAGWLPPVRRALLARLATLEIEADAAAVAAGVRPATLASALLKCDPDPDAYAAASAFSTAAEVRIGELLAWGRAERTEFRPSLPLEWAAPAAAAALLACHVVGV